MIALLIIGIVLLNVFVFISMVYADKTKDLVMPVLVCLFVAFFFIIPLTSFTIAERSIDKSYKEGWVDATNGVNALLGRYYFNNNANIWLWGLYGNEDPRGFDITQSNIYT